MKKIFHLSTCNTCQRILGELDTNGIEIQNVKEQHITAKELDEAKSVVGSYEGLLNKRAVKYRALDLKNKDLSDDEYRQYILDEYTLLKRPLAMIDGEVFAGNSKKIIEALKNKING